MLALVDGVPRTLSLDAFIRHWVNHQLEVIERRTRYLKREAEERDHILQGLLKAMDAIDEVIRLIRSSQGREDARPKLMEFLDIDQVQADAILSMQLVRLANMERQKIIDEHEELMRKIADYNDILAKPERQRTIVGDELDEIVAKYGDERRTEDPPLLGRDERRRLIAEENVVVTVTHSGFIKRTKANEYRAQHRGGKGIKGAKLREDDVVDHFFLTSTHNWLLFFTNKGRVYRISVRAARRLARFQGPARGEPAAVRSRRDDSDRAVDSELRGRQVSGACHPHRQGQEDRAGRVRFAASGRTHRGSSRGRRGDRRAHGRADRRRALQRRRRHHPRLQAGHEPQVRGGQRPAASDGTPDRRRAGHEVPRG